MAAMTVPRCEHRPIKVDSFNHETVCEECRTVELYDVTLVKKIPYFFGLLNRNIYEVRKVKRVLDV